MILNRPPLYFKVKVQIIKTKVNNSDVHVKNISLSLNIVYEYCIRLLEYLHFSKLKNI